LDAVASSHGLTDWVGGRCVANPETEQRGMRIVILDGIDIGAEYLARLERRGDVQAYAGVPATTDEIVERARGAEIVLNSWTRMGRDVFERLPDLRLVSLAASGVDYVDVAAAAAHGVTVCSVPHYATTAVAERALGLMLSVARRIPAVDGRVRRTCAIDWDAPEGVELCGRTLGVVGTGAIGRRVARLARGIGMDVVGYDPLPAEAPADGLELRYLTLPRVFAESDVVTLHVPLTSQTRGLVDAGLLALMPSRAFLINTARAGLLEQDALYAALREGRLAGAGLDDIDLTRASGRGLLELDTVVFTPHIGFKTHEAVASLAACCADNALRFLDGEPRNVVAPAAS
jgi:phosphoglycerate dehydrogenase-like enzyme